MRQLSHFFSQKNHSTLMYVHWQKCNNIWLTVNTETVLRPKIALLNIKHWRPQFCTIFCAHHLLRGEKKSFGLFLRENVNEFCVQYIWFNNFNYKIDRTFNNNNNASAKRLNCYIKLLLKFLESKTVIFSTFTLLKCK